MNLKQIVDKAAKPWHRQYFHQMLYKWLASPFIWVFLKIKTTPNQITALATLCKLIALPFYLTLNQIPAIIFHQLWYILDGADGSVARIRNLSSKRGAMIDGILDTITNNLFFIALPLGVFLAYKSTNIIILAMTLLAIVGIRESLCAKGDGETYTQTRESTKQKFARLAKVFSSLINFNKVIFPFIILFPLTVILHFYLLNIAVETIRILFYSHMLITSIKK
ncbi:MAG: CDP-alcohol phosphatidyltransferase family protein [Nanoarchaeota archaeon]|nr:CDP-alcohol phosphatidyltransferase family protein [Nanoarchaeota archaeon]